MYSVEQLIRSYIRNNDRLGHLLTDGDNIAQILEQHRENKMNDPLLNKIFGEGEYFFRQPIEVAKPQHEVYQELRVSKLVNTIRDWSYTRYRQDMVTPEFHTYLCDLVSPEVMITQRVHKNASLEFKGNTCKLQAGQKIVNAIRMLNKAFFEFPEEDIEKFRVRYSRVIQEAVFKGTLTISRHPMDYITCSDNDAKWSSCLSVKQDGCYKSGLMEMMLNTNTVIAYLSSNSQKLTWDDNGVTMEWNSKKWRQYVTVDSAVLMASRQYPYTLTHVSSTVLDVVNKALDNEYLEAINYYNGSMDYEERRDSNLGLSFNMRRMYNDFHEQDDYDYFVMYHKHYDELRKLHWAYNRYNIDMTVPNYDTVPCLKCGEELGGGEDRHLFCPDCREEFRCSHCGDDVDGSEAYTRNGMRYCQCCYEDLFRDCPHCGESFSVADMLEYSILEFYTHNITESLVGRRVCPDCFRASIRDSLLFETEPTKLDGDRIREINKALLHRDSASTIEGMAEMLCENMFSHENISLEGEFVSTITLDQPITYAQPLRMSSVSVANVLP